MAEENKRAMEMLAQALEIETRGMNFYKDAIAKCTNNLGREIFATLMGDENVHIERIKAIYDSLKSTNSWTDRWQKMENKHESVEKLFTDIANKTGTNIKADTSDINALDVGMGFEQKSVKFYEDHLLKATDPMERKFVEKMIGEERSHYKVLADMKLYLSDPSAWFTEQEHHGLDG